ncbi:MAG: DsbA family protein, partial [Brevibacterium aurantiacum]
FHEKLFAGGKPRPPEELSPEALTSVAADIGLDMNQFEKDMNSSETAAAVDKNAKMGTELGAFSTPTFILGDQPYVGAQPTSVFVDAIEQKLEGAN